MMIRKKILIIDDERDIGTLLGEAFEDEGYDVLVCFSAMSALEEMDKFAADLILTDVMMPIMNGLELTRRIRGLPAYKETPIILMSAGNVSGSQEEYQWTDFLKKPFNLQKILSTVQKYMEEI